MTPIIKWAGGKRQLLDCLKENIPTLTGTYVEPFIGSGALFFDLSPTKAIINDNNSELINMYISVRDELEVLLILLKKYQDEYLQLDETMKETYYYDRRAEFNNNILSKNLTVKDAALFIFLNKTCYNGLYRVNAKGLFNTPYGKRKKINLINEDNVRKCSHLLQNTNILCGDFESACCNLQKGDFVYFDSPYYNTFDTYQAGGFPLGDHERLFCLFKHLTSQGVYCMLSNSNTEYIRELYGDYEIDTIAVARMINCKKERNDLEIIIRNF